jgi:hypothetical protein
MRSCSRLGAANLALISFYFAPVWGRDAIRALMSPYSGLEDRVHSAAALYFRKLFDVGPDGLALVANVLSGIKLVIAAAFLAYAIEFMRALVKERDVDRDTVDVVLALAFVGIAVWALPALALEDGALVRLYATQLLLVVGAIFVILIERHVEQPPEPASHVTTAEAESDVAARLVARVAAIQQPAGLTVRVPEHR